MNAISALKLAARDKANGKKSSPVKLTSRTLGTLARVFRQLADESRLKILLALAQEGEMDVTALCAVLNQTQPAVSHHLTLLRLTGLVNYRREGKHNFYRVESGVVGELFEEFFSDMDCGKSLSFKDFSLAFARSR